MQVKVLYFASVREKLGLNAEDLDLPASVATVAGLRAHLRARGDAWSDALADTKLLRTAVNQDLAPPTTAIKAGDEVAFFPPVTGG